MSNRRELKNARDRADYALAALEAIEALPRRRGARVRWSNGLVWERVGDDHWSPLYFRQGNKVIDMTDDQFPYSSEHVATSAGTWRPVEHLKGRAASIHSRSEEEDR